MEDAAAVREAPPTTQRSPAKLKLGHLIRGTRHAYDEYRNQTRLTGKLGWTNRKLLDIECGRRKPTERDLAQLSEVLPLLRTLLAIARPAGGATDGQGRA